MKENIRILIVEDNSIVAADIKDRLERMGYQVSDKVSRGESAIKSVEENTPNIILMDINLKGEMSGIEAASSIRERYDIPVIYLTSYTDNDTIQRAKLTEPFGYIVKPFDDKELRSTIEISIYKHHMERKLKEKEQWLQTTLESIGDGVIATDMKGVITFMNPIAESLTGWPLTDAMSKPLSDVFNIVNENTKEQCENPLAKILESGKIVGLTNNTLLITRDGSTLPIKDSGSPIIYDNTEKLGVVLVFQDNSKEREAEKKLKESEERFKKLFEYAPLPYQSLDDQGYILEVNHTWLTLLGYEKKDVVGKFFGDFLHPDWQNHFKENFPKFKALGEIIGVQFEMKKSDGSFLFVQFDGKIHRDQSGAVVQTHCVFRDITAERKLKEKIEQHEAVLRQNQKLEAIGTLAGGIAHDFNNILSSIMGFTELCLADVKKGSELHDYLSEVLASSIRARDLVKQILTFSRKGEDQKNLVYLSPLIKDSMKMLRATIPTNIKVQSQINDEKISVNGNGNQLNQVLVNLVTNAVHSIENFGEINIGLEKEYINPSDAEKHHSLEPGYYAKLFVNDNGCGIAEEHLNTIFDPYFTLKSPEKGSGLGLSVVHGIIRSHRGHITVKSKVGRGTTFTIYFPVSTQESNDTSVKVAEHNLRGKEHILLVDDEPSIVTVQKKNLERMGYTVTAQTNGIEALTVFRSSPDIYDMLITDMTMPHITGEQLAKEMKEIRADLPVILCTGYNEKINANNMRRKGIDGFLMKPVELKKMTAKIREIFDGKWEENI